MINEGGWQGAFANEDGSDIVSLPPEEPRRVRRRLVYQPFFSNLNGEAEGKTRGEAKTY